jgi:hypothetical protein
MRFLVPLNDKIVYKLSCDHKSPSPDGNENPAAECASFGCFCAATNGSWARAYQNSAVSEELEWTAGIASNKKTTLKEWFCHLFWVVHFETFHELGGVISSHIIGFVHQLTVERNRGFDAFNVKLV